MPKRIIGKLQTPADSNGTRQDIHVVTSTASVLVDDTKTLDTLLIERGFGLNFSEEKPEYACLWAQVKSKETITTD